MFLFFLSFPSVQYHRQYVSKTEVAHAVFYTYQTSGTCAGVWVCYCMDQMKKTIKSSFFSFKLSGCGFKPRFSPLYFYQLFPLFTIFQHYLPSIFTIFYTTFTIFYNTFTNFYLFLPPSIKFCYLSSFFTNFYTTFTNFLPPPTNFSITACL